MSCHSSFAQLLHYVKGWRDFLRTMPPVSNFTTSKGMACHRAWRAAPEVQPRLNLTAGASQLTVGPRSQNPNVLRSGPPPSLEIGDQLRSGLYSQMSGTSHLTVGPRSQFDLDLKSSTCTVYMYRYTAVHCCTVRSKCIGKLHRVCTNYAESCEQDFIH